MNFGTDFADISIDDVDFADIIYLINLHFLLRRKTGVYIFFKWTRLPT